MELNKEDMAITQLKANKRSGMNSHQSSKLKSDEWLTPPYILEQLGPFDLDPCAPVIRPWSTAKLHYSIMDNGLLMPWYSDFVWCNPPYGFETTKWLEKMAEHNNGIALTFARTETTMFQKYVWLKASSLLFLYGRLHFYYVNGTKAKFNAGAPSVLIAYGPEADKRLQTSNINGYFVKL